MLSLETFHLLRTAQGAAALAAAADLAPTEATTLPALTQLRKRFTPDLAAAALETVLLRARARAKFGHAGALFFTREALEQASDERVAAQRARRYHGAAAPVYDVCCSVGGDLLGLAQAGHTVVGVDYDPLRLAMAEANAAALGVAERVRFQLADARQFDAPAGSYLFFDPARRRSGRGGNRQRVFSPDDYEPSLSLLERWLPRAAGFGVKVAPGIDYAALPYRCEVEIVSVAGEVKEACLWFGALRRHERSATVIETGGAAHTLVWTPTPQIAAMEPRAYLYEPDGAVIRAHLVEQLAEQLGAVKIDEQIAFLTADDAHATPFARAFAVQEVLPFSLKRLRSRLRELDVGRVVVKKRGSPIDPQLLEQQLRLEPTRPNQMTLVLTHVLGQPSVILCAPVQR